MRSWQACYVRLVWTLKIIIVWGSYFDRFSMFLLWVWGLVWIYGWWNLMKFDGFGYDSSGVSLVLRCVSFLFTTSWTVLNSVCICRVVLFLTVGSFLAWVCISSMLNCLLNWALLFWFCVSSSTVLNCLNWAFDLYNLFLLSSLLSAVCCELPLNYA